MRCHQRHIIARPSGLPECRFRNRERLGKDFQMDGASGWGLNGMPGPNNRGQSLNSKVVSSIVAFRKSHE